MLDPSVDATFSHDRQPPAAAVPNGAAAPQNAEELQQLQAKLERLLSQQRELMKLLGTTREDRIVHDVRNLLQERIFLLAACKASEEGEE